MEKTFQIMLRLLIHHCPQVHLQAQRVVQAARRAARQARVHHPRTAQAV